MDIGIGIDHFPSLSPAVLVSTTRETEHKIYKYIRTYKTGLQWPPIELDVEKCRDSPCMLEIAGFSQRSGAHCRVPGKSVQGGHWVCDGRLKGLCWKPGDVSEAKVKPGALLKNRSRSMLLHFPFTPFK